MPGAPGANAIPEQLAIDPIACAELLQATGQEQFSRTLLKLATKIVAVEEIFAWVGAEGSPPAILAAASRHEGQEDRIKSYAGRFFRDDPLIEPGGPDGFFVRVVAAREIGFAEYRRICFSRPLFDHKISFVRRAVGQSIVLNFYLRQGGKDPDTVLTGLTTLATVAIASLHRRIASQSECVDDAAQRLAARIGDRFSQLSPMETRVLARLALAQSPARIAEALDIRPSTVKTYRARALVKCGCRDVASILALIVD